MLEIIGLDRTKVYVANIVKCRPPRNRDPLNVEQDACIGWLRRQTALLRPKIIICLGRIAAKVIIKEDFKITAEHGQWFQRSGVQMTAIYHPSALLRDERKRPETFGRPEIHSGQNPGSLHAHHDLTGAEHHFCRPLYPAVPSSSLPRRDPAGFRFFSSVNYNINQG